MQTSYLPNFLFIGPDKAGSTWLYQYLYSHPECFMSPAKELFYFDYYYHKGSAWYFKHFKGARPEHLVVGEVSHDYLFSKKACERIKRDLPDVRLMVEKGSHLFYRKGVTPILYKATAFVETMAEQDPRNGPQGLNTFGSETRT